MPGLASELPALVRIQREVDILSSLHHRHIIGYRGLRREDETLNILMEYAAGGTLREALSLRRASEPARFPSDLVLAWGAELACALHVVHRANVPTRPLEPEPARQTRACASDSEPARAGAPSARRRGSTAAAVAAAGSPQPRLLRAPLARAHPLPPAPNTEWSPPFAGRRLGAPVAVVP